jgi:GATA-binding protein
MHLPYACARVLLPDGGIMRCSLLMGPRGSVKGPDWLPSYLITATVGDRRVILSSCPPRKGPHRTVSSIVCDDRTLLFHFRSWFARSGPDLRYRTGLYFKLHGTHRPFSMKKAVIKRRKRVPAAAAAAPGRPSGRLSDQAAAEALVSVGRGMHSTEEDEAEADEAAQPKRKRQRRSLTKGGAGARRKDRGDEDGHGSASASPQQAHHPWDAPPHAHAHAHAGLDLPPLAHLMPQADMAMFPYMVNVGGPGMFPKTMYHAMHSVPPPASSYVRSSSRAQSPSGGMPLPLPPGVGGMFLGRLSPGGVPTLDDLQAHYREMDAQRRATADMLERTERMMDALRRTIEGAGGAPPQGLPPLAALAAPVPMEEDAPEQPPQPMSGPGVAPAPAPAPAPVPASSVPLPRPASAPGARSPRESVWSVVGGSPRDT